MKNDNHNLIELGTASTSTQSGGDWKLDIGIGMQPRIAPAC